MKKILIVTYTSGHGDPFSADCLDTVLETLEANHGGSVGHVAIDGTTRNAEIEWLNDEGEVDFHVWAENGEHIEARRRVA